MSRIKTGQLFKSSPVRATGSDVNRNVQNISSADISDAFRDQQLGQTRINSAKNFTEILNTSGTPVNNSITSSIANRLSGTRALISPRSIPDRANSAVNSPDGPAMERLAETTNDATADMDLLRTDLARANMTQGQFNQYESALNVMNARSQAVGEAVRTGQPDSVIQQRLDELDSASSNNALNNPRLELTVTAGVGTTKAQLSKVSLKYRRAALALGGIAGFMFLSWAISRELTGCYQYTGSVSEKLPCPTEANTCACGSATKGISDPAQLRTICGGYPPGSGTYANYPFCCQEGMTTCTGNVGDPTAIYYGWKEVPPSAVLPILGETIADLASDVIEGGFDFIGNLIQYGGVILAVIVVLFILYYAFKTFRN